MKKFIKEVSNNEDDDDQVFVVFLWKYTYVMADGHIIHAWKYINWVVRNNFFAYFRSSAAKDILSYG